LDSLDWAPVNKFCSQRCSNSSQSNMSSRSSGFVITAKLTMEQQHLNDDTLKMFKSKYLLFITTDNTFALNEPANLFNNSLCNLITAQGCLDLMCQILSKFWCKLPNFYIKPEQCRFESYPSEVKI
jgi:hypothetical protein